MSLILFSLCLIFVPRHSHAEKPLENTVTGVYFSSKSVAQAVRFSKFDILTSPHSGKAQGQRRQRFDFCSLAHSSIWERRSSCLLRSVGIRSSIYPFSTIGFPGSNSRMRWWLIAKKLTRVYRISDQGWAAVMFVNVVRFHVAIVIPPFFITCRAWFRSKCSLPPNLSKFRWRFTAPFIDS